MAGTERFKMKLQIATNFDRRLVEEIVKCNDSGVVASVYGKLRKDLIGGGRSSMILPEVSMEELKAYIALCHKNRLKFNYVINALCMSNREFQVGFHKKILKFISRLVDAGVDSVTVNSPYLCELLKSRFDGLHLTVGLNARITTLQHVKYWEGLGADEITLYHDVNRNFGLLESILRYTRNTGTGLRLIANNVCLHECPYQINHSISQSHASQKGHHSSQFNIDYSVLSCTNTKVKNPTTLIAAEWIRPEDIRYYEQLCEKTGNYNLSLKLVERTKSTDFLVRVLKAYTARSYEGNLMDLLNWPKAKENHQVHLFPAYIKMLSELYNFKELLKMKEVSGAPALFVDNKKLDGFLDRFITSFNCRDMVCDDKGWKGRGSGNQGDDAPMCSYCRMWAEKAISCDEREVEDWIAKSDDFLQGLKNSRVFYWK